MSFNTYSFKAVDVIWGIIEFEEFADGDDIVTIVTETPQWNKTVGGKGDAVRSQTSDNSCTVTVKLLETSKTNKLLYIAFNSDRETQIGIGTMIVINKDTGKKSIINNAWIQKLPDESQGQAVPVLTWTLDGDFLTTVVE